MPENANSASFNWFLSRKSLFPHLLMIVCVCYLTFFYRLGARPIADPDEGRYAESVREMILHHEWITPTFNAEPRLDKPILLYWFVIVAQKIFGLNEFALRFFSALFAFLSVLLIWAAVRLLCSPLEGLLTALILSTSILYVSVARLLLPDMYLSCFIALALLSFYFFTLTEHRFFLFSTYVGFGLGIFTKGPVAFILPAIIILLFLLIQGKLSILKRSKPLLGLLIVCLIVLPWFIPLLLEHKGILKYYFWQQTLQRFFTSKFKRTQSLHYFFLLFLATFFPWTLFLIGAAIDTLKRGIRRLCAEHPFQLFLWLWLIVSIIFFTISRSQQPVYITPLFPAAAALAAQWASQRLFSRSQQTIRDKSWLIPAVLCLFAVILLIQLPRIASLLQAYSQMLYPATTAFLILNAASLLLWIRDRKRAAFWLLCAALIFFIVLLLPSIDKYLGDRRSAKAASELLLPTLRPEDAVVSYKSDARASMMFYLQRTIPSFDSADELEKRIDSSTGRTFIFCRPRHLDKLLDQRLVNRVIYRGYDLVGVLATSPEKP
jgi:4-amino-4-deoxy-L-arabinose transferase-like glycosyltransferase